MAFFKGYRAKSINCFGFYGEEKRPHRWGKYNVTAEQWEPGECCFINDTFHVLFLVSEEIVQASKDTIENHQIHFIENF